MLLELTNGAAIPQSSDWKAFMAQLDSRQVIEIDEATYTHFLEVLPPIAITGAYFFFAEGQEPLTIFWLRKGRYYARRTTWNETGALCRECGINARYWA